jgi:hypothetical protein
MCAHHLPRAAVSVESQNSCEPLEVIVDEGMVQFLCGLFAGRGHDAVVREESKFAAGGGLHGLRMHS